MQLDYPPETRGSRRRCRFSIPVQIAIVLVVTAILSLSAVKRSSAAKTQAKHPAPEPIGQVDLATYGFQGRPPVKFSNADTWGTATYDQGVVFIDSKVLAAYFVVHEDPPGVTATGRTPLPSDTYRFVVLFFNSDTHELIKKLAWVMPSSVQYVSAADLFPAINGSFLVRIGDTLWLYSSSFQVITHRTVGWGVEIIASPPGDTLLLEKTDRVNGQWTQQSDLIDTTELKTIKSWSSSPPQQVENLWHDQLVVRNRRSLSIQTLDAEARPFLPSRDAGGGKRLDQNTLVLVEGGPVQNVTVLSIDDKVLRKFDLGLEQSDGPIVASKDGRRYAVPTMRWGAGHNNNPDEVRARVFSVDSDAPLLNIKVPLRTNGGPDFFTPAGDTRFGAGGLALSPDGLLLAVKSGGIIQFYSLPAAGSSPPACSGDCPTASDLPPAESPSEPQTAEAKKPVAAAPPSPVVEQTLSWLPADTETVFAANGPIPFPDLATDEDAGGGANRAPNSESTEANEIRNIFQPVPLGLFGFKKNLLGKSFAGTNTLFAIEGARHFGTPSGLGMGPYQGCDIAIFDKDVTANASAFLKSSANDTLKTEHIEGQLVSVFQEKLEEDTWTTYVAFPKPNVAVAATSEEYLREVLLRIHGKTSARALPETLPEWKYADTHAEFWAVRHYDAAGVKIDPSSPFLGEHSQSFEDTRAIGLVFAFSPSTSKTASIIYLSGDTNVRPIAEKYFSSMNSETGAREMRARYQVLAPGVVETSVDLDHIESAQLFALMLLSMVGHVVFI